MSIKPQKMTVTSLIILFYVLLVLFLPNFIMNVTQIYSIDATGYVAHDEWERSNPWLFYNFSAVEIIVILYAIFKKPKPDDISIKPVVVFILFENVIRYLLNATSIFGFGDYSLLLSLMAGFGCYLLVVNNPLNMDLEDVMDLIIILNFVTQLLFVFTGRQMDYDGRYAALGSTVGDVGTMCFHYLIYFVFARHKKSNNVLPVICCILSLIISGSRSNLLFSILFILVFAFRIRQGENKENTNKVAFIILLAGIVVIVPLLIFFESNASSPLTQVLNRVQGFISSIFGGQGNEYFEADSSFSGRLDSFAAGFRILAQNPLGISTSAIDLQVETIKNGYYTFPHSTLFCYYLLWGIPTLFVFGSIIKMAVVGIKKKSNVSILLISIIIELVLYGSPIINAKMYFWYFVVFAYCKRILSAQAESEQEISDNEDAENTEETDEIAAQNPFMRKSKYIIEKTSSIRKKVALNKQKNEAAKKSKYIK